MPKISHKAFTERLLADAKNLPAGSEEYILSHSVRFYDTFLVCAKYLKAGDQVLSVGSGIGSIEKMLQEELGVQITVVDFPDPLNDLKDYFDKMGFIPFPANLVEETLQLPKSRYQMLLYSEVIEHVPLAPQDQLRKFDDSLAPGARIVISTPNHGSIFHVLKTLMMMPILEPAEQTFSPVVVENQGIHRREYFPSEIAESFRKLGYRHISTKYFFYKTAKNLMHRLFYAVGTVIPRFKYGMIVVGEK